MNWIDYPRGDDGGGDTVAGTIKVLRALRSPQLGNERDVLVYLPPSYADGERHYPVVYMHDGQNLFDPTTSFSGEWEVDQTLEAAGREDGLEAIVVGLPNMGAGRLAEYSPFVDARLGGGRGGAYVDFIADTVKPMVDAEFRTQPSRAATGIAGSSMGALVSLFGFFHRPETFGFVGAMSPAFWFASHAIFGYVREAPYVAGRVYLDVGTQEGSAELRDVRRMRDLLRQKGYRPGRELLYVEEPGAGHNEAAWAGRLRSELEFLLGATSPEPARRAAGS